MKIKLFIITLSIVFVPFSVTRAIITGNVSTDIIGNVNYTFSDGTSGYSYKDNANYTHYQFNNGLYGSSYTDITGATHYYFNETSKNIYINGTCIYPTAGSCMYESQYQEMYDKAAQGLPSCSQTGETGSFPVSAEYCTPEGKEKLIMSGSYGSWLKMCRESIDNYTKFQATYDSCVKAQNEKYEKMAQMKLDILKQQLDNERTRLEIENIKKNTEILKNELETKQQKTCPTKSTLNNYGICICEVGLVMNKQKTGCFTCEQLNPESFTEVYGQLTACTTCNDGYYLDKINKKCVLITENKIENKKDTPTAIGNTPQKVNVDVIKKAVIIDNTKIEIDNNQTTTTNVIIEQTINSSTTESKTIVNEPTKNTGVFQKIGQKTDSTLHGVSSFFKNIFGKLKFW